MIPPPQKHGGGLPKIAFGDDARRLAAAPRRHAPAIRSRRSPSSPVAASVLCSTAHSRKPLIASSGGTGPGSCWRARILRMTSAEWTPWASAFRPLRPPAPGLLMSGKLAAECPGGQAFLAFGDRRLGHNPKLMGRNDDDPRRSHGGGCDVLILITRKAHAGYARAEERN